MEIALKQCNQSNCSISPLEVSNSVNMLTEIESQVPYCTEVKHFRSHAGRGGGGVRMSLIESYSVNCGQAMGALALHGYEHILWVR